MHQPLWDKQRTPPLLHTIALLERGLHYARQGTYGEAVRVLTDTLEQLPFDQISLATVIERFIQNCESCWHAQQALNLASKHFAEIDGAQEIQLLALEKLLSSLQKETPDALLSPQTTSPNSTLYTQLASPGDKNALSELSIVCFGHFEVRREGKPIVLCSSRSGQRILRYLVAQPKRCSTSDTLLALLWPEDEPKVAQSKLHIAISALRHSLNHGYACPTGHGYIVCKKHVYSFNPAVTIKTDVDEFMYWYQLGQHTPEEQIALYERACTLYTGPFLTEDVYADWPFLQREQYSQAYLSMCRVLSEHYLKVHAYEDAAKWATAILEEDRCDETAYRQLIQIYVYQGNRSKAVRQYQLCEKVLLKELGVQLSPETVQVFQQFLAQDAVLS